MFLLCLGLPQLANAQGDKSIPPSGPKRDNQDELSKLKNDRTEFISQFIKRLKKCPKNPNLVWSESEKANLSIGNIYEKLVLVQFPKGFSGGVACEKLDRTVSCIFKPYRIRQHVRSIVENPQFDTYLREMYPMLEHPEDVRKFFESILEAK